MELNIITYIMNIMKIETNFRSLRLKLVFYYNIIPAELSGCFNSTK